LDETIDALPAGNSTLLKILDVDRLTSAILSTLLEPELTGINFEFSFRRALHEHQRAFARTGFHCVDCRGLKE
jgi:hypothetical protein